MKFLKFFAWTLPLWAIIQAIIWTDGMSHGVNLFTTAYADNWWWLINMGVWVAFWFAAMGIIPRLHRILNDDDSYTELIDVDDLTDEEREALEQAVWKVAERVHNEKENK